MDSKEHANFINPSGSVSKATAFSCAGTAFHRAQKLCTAEEMLFLALKEDYCGKGHTNSADGLRVWNLDHPETNHHWRNFYLTVEHVVQALNERGEAHSNDGQNAILYWAAINGLLCAANFTTREFTEKYSTFSQGLTKLRPCYRNPARAIDALSRAVEQSSSVTELRDMLVECVQPMRPGTVLLSATFGSKESSRTTKDRKKDAREQLFESPHRDPPNPKECDNCNKFFESVKYCACNGVHYCSRECQVAHW